MLVVSVGPLVDGESCAINCVTTPVPNPPATIVNPTIAAAILTFVHAIMVVTPFAMEMVDVDRVITDVVLKALVVIVATNPAGMA